MCKLLERLNHFYIIKILILKWWYNQNDIDLKTPKTKNTEYSGYEFCFEIYSEPVESILRGFEWWHEQIYQNRA